MQFDTNKVVAVDFDGTIAKHSTYYYTGKLDETAKYYINKLYSLGYIIVIWTTRIDDSLEECKDLLKLWGIKYHYINEYPLRESGRKINCDWYIDDKSYFAKLNWKKIFKYIVKH